MSDFKVAGIASGFDWSTMVDQLMEIERIPQQRLRTEQSTNTTKKDALDLLQTKIETLQTSVGEFTSSAVFNAKQAVKSDDTLNISASADTTTAPGKYEIAVTQLATVSKRSGTTDVGGTMGDGNTVLTNLRLATDITEGTFQVNGQEVTVASTDTLEDVLDAISAATSGVVSASYNGITDTVKLSSMSGQLELGGADDTSNFLAALKLDQLEVINVGGGVSEVSSKSSLGVVDLSAAIVSSGIGGPISGSGTFYINGVSIDFDADVDSVQSLMNTVNASAAGVSMSYDTASDQFRIVNDKTGAYEMPVIDSSNNLLAALGLTGSAAVGDDLNFTVDGGGALTSRENVITSSEHGITGLTVTAAEVGTQSITITRDSTELKAHIDKFISAYNGVQDYIQEKTKVEAVDDEVTSGTLAGNREVSALDSQLRNLAFSAISGMSGDLFRLEHIGIDFISGTSKLEIKDNDALTNAFETNLDTLEDFFMGDTENSFATRMKSFITNYTASDGVLDVQIDTLTSRNLGIDNQIEEMERRLEFKRSALEASFIAMESAQQNISTQSQALASLGGF